MHTFLRNMASLSRYKIAEEVSRAKKEPDLRRLVTCTNTYDVIARFMFDECQRNVLSGLPAGSTKQQEKLVPPKVSGLSMSL